MDDVIKLEPGAPDVASRHVTEDILASIALSPVRLADAIESMPDLSGLECAIDELSIQLTNEPDAA
jgi:hypothetical protein